MPRKPKFRPRITRIKLNPEQAVLACSCWDAGVSCCSSNSRTDNPIWYVLGCTPGYRTKTHIVGPCVNTTGGWGAGPSSGSSMVS